MNRFLSEAPRCAEAHRTLSHICWHLKALPALLTERKRPSEGHSHSNISIWCSTETISMAEQTMIAMAFRLCLEDTLHQPRWQVISNILERFHQISSLLDGQSDAVDLLMPNEEMLMKFSDGGKTINHLKSILAISNVRGRYLTTNTLEHPVSFHLSSNSSIFFHLQK